MNGRRSRRNDNNFYGNLGRERVNRTDRNVEMYFKNNFVQQPRPRYVQQRMIVSNPRYRSAPEMRIRRAPLRSRGNPIRQRREYNLEPRNVEYRPRKKVINRRREKQFNQQAPVKRNERRIISHILILFPAAC